ncbi:hypothetical protein QYE76_070052 [Lolium multiflorum]|uniref:Plant heme peroxidase family profile domain-containing protein n=1 Tax=Lolium multiflorum TaxID=4521 RepID=A0AAD8WFI1_LOLMU|nr:hypothetical protein QYE76_070052 [Lolium multiflorum]
MSACTTRAISMPASRRFGWECGLGRSAAAAWHPFDVHNADGFNNAYYQNLVGRRMLLHSDQELFNGNAQDMLMRQYINTPRKISTNFVSAI